jgi:hypothetical protein
MNDANLKLRNKFDSPTLLETFIELKHVHLIIINAFPMTFMT